MQTGSRRVLSLLLNRKKRSEGGGGEERRNLTRTRALPRSDPEERVYWENERHFV
jgi:hypothetical protein